MSRALLFQPLRVLLALTPALELIACATPADPAAITARQAFEAVHADPVIVSSAPDALASAREAVEAAEHPAGDASDAATLAFVAQKRVDIVRAQAAANVDSKKFDEMVARRNAIRHGDDSITTLSTDAFDLTPHAVRLQSVGPNSQPLPPPGVELPTAAPAPETVEPVYVEPAAIPLPSGPLLELGGNAFSADAAPLTSTRTQLDGLLASFAHWPDQPVAIAYSSTDKAGARRAASVRTYLIGRGVPAARLLSGSSTSASGSASDNGLIVDFIRAAAKP